MQSTELQLLPLAHFAEFNKVFFQYRRLRGFEEKGRHSILNMGALNNWQMLVQGKANGVPRWISLFRKKLGRAVIDVSREPSKVFSYLGMPMFTCSNALEPNWHTCFALIGDQITWLGCADENWKDKTTAQHHLDIFTPIPLACDSLPTALPIYTGLQTLSCSLLPFMSPVGNLATCIAPIPPLSVLKVNNTLTQVKTF